MAWTNLTFNINSILTALKMTQLDANLDSLAAGDSGAPEITQQAMVDYTIGSLEVVTSNSLSSVTGTTPTKIREFTISRNGDLKFVMLFQRTGGGLDANVQIYRNGGALGSTEKTNNATPTPAIFDVTGWSINDRAQIFAWSDGAGDTVGVSSISVSNGQFAETQEIYIKI